MTARLDGKSRSDEGTFRKYASLEEKQAARQQQKLEASRRYRERNRERLRERSFKYRAKNKKECIKRTQRWQEENPDRVRDKVYQRKYGISLEEYEGMVSDRKSLCDICKTESKLVIDHCHNSNKVRGLLCDRCNVGLGCLGDDPRRLLSASAYLNGDPNYIDSWHDIIGYVRLVEKRLEEEQQ